MLSKYIQPTLLKNSVVFVCFESKQSSLTECCPFEKIFLFEPCMLNSNCCEIHNLKIQFLIACVFHVLKFTFQIPWVFELERFYCINSVTTLNYRTCKQKVWNRERLVGTGPEYLPKIERSSRK